MQKLIPLNNILAKGYLAYTGFKEIIKQNRKYLILAFQRRFRQSLINGKSDQECYLISKNLLKS